MLAAVPRVSADYQARRRQHILRAARSCFSRLGFRATSMQDILREADVSAGALYCYFGGKDDLVAAIIDEVLNEITAGVESLPHAEQPPPIAAILDYLFSVFEQRDPTHELTRLAVEVWAESLHDSDLATRVAERYGRLQDMLARLLAESSTNAQLPPGVPTTTVARVLVGLGPIYLLQRALLGDSEANSFRTAVGALLFRAGTYGTSS